MLVHPKTVQYHVHGHVMKICRRKTVGNSNGEGCARDVPTMNLKISWLGKNPSWNLLRIMGSRPKTTLFGWNRTSRKVRFVELSSCTNTRRGFADVCHPQGRWGFREVLVHVSLALLMALMGRTMMTNKHFIARRVPGKSCFVDI